MVAHELGHTVGLRHSSVSSEVMYAYYTGSKVVTFGSREVLTMALMAQRRGGNTWPDNDRATSATAARVVTEH
jgi:hypothetical protein